MSFGKRGKGQEPPGATRHPRKPAAAAELPDAIEEPTVSTSVLARQLRGIAIGVAIAIGLMALNYVGMRYYGQQLGASFVERAGPIAWHSLIPSSPESMTPMQRRVLEACTPSIFLDRINRAQRTAMIPGGSFANDEIVQASLVGEYLACTIARVNDRFCHADGRRALVSDIRKYVTLRDRALQRIAEERAIRSGHFQDVGRALGRPSGLEVVEDPEEPLREIARALRGVTQAGYLSTGDLSQMNAGALERYVTPLLEISSTEKPCR